MNYNRVDMELVVGGRGSSLKVDGTEIKGVRNIKVETAWDDMTSVTVTFLAFVNCAPKEPPARPPIEQPPPERSPCIPGVGRSKSAARRDYNEELEWAPFLGPRIR